MTKAEYLSLETKACRYHARSAVTEPGVKSLPAPEVQEPPALQGEHSCMSTIFLFKPKRAKEWSKLF